MTESKNSSKSGRFAEILGHYDPRKTSDTLKSDRITHWLTQGAGVTGSVNNLLIKKGLIHGQKTHVGADYVAPAPKVEVVSQTEPEPTPEVVPVVENTPVETSTPVEETPVEAPVEAPAEAPTE